MGVKNQTVTDYNPHINSGYYPLNSKVTSRKVAFTAQSDTFSLSTDNQVQDKRAGLSINAKLGIGALILAGFGTAAYVLSREKLGTKFVQQLAEHIDFKQAATYEEAVQFGKTHLGIKEYKGFQAKDIDVINWINEGIVNVSNKMKGKSKIPKKIIYEPLDEDTILGVNRRGNVLSINRSVFDDVDKAIKDYLNDGSDITFMNGKYSYPEIFSTNTIKELLQKLDKFRNHPNNCSFKEKVELYENLLQVSKEDASFILYPINRIKSILQTPEAKERISSIGLEYNIDNIAKMSIDEQLDLLMKYIRGANIKQSFKLTSCFDSIYHEFGHLNDPKLSSRAFTREVYDTQKIAYPTELKEWLNNTEKQRIAGKVSCYATENPAEFIAETFAKLIEGSKVSDDVMALYKKYGGPALA